LSHTSAEVNDTVKFVHNDYHHGRYVHQGHKGIRGSFRLEAPVCGKADKEIEKDRRNDHDRPVNGKLRIGGAPARRFQGDAEINKDEVDDIGNQKVLSQPPPVVKDNRNAAGSQVDRKKIAAVPADNGKGGADYINKEGTKKRRYCAP
jgi:hypothetical protein